MPCDVVDPWLVLAGLGVVFGITGTVARWRRGLRGALLVAGLGLTAVSLVVVAFQVPASGCRA